MGLMKRFLMDKIEEWQRLHPQWSLKDIYEDDNLYRMASEYAERQLKAMEQNSEESHGEG